jgi:hypothetical protein
MTIPKDVPQPEQPEIPVHGREDRPRRARRTLPAYPDSPIVIPSERKEAARELLSVVNELWEQGRHYDALLKWFELPLDKRDDVINTTLLQEAEPAGRSLRSAQYDTEGKPEHLILKHYALLATSAVGKIIRPNENDPITFDDTVQISSNPGVPDREQSFRFRLRSLGLGLSSYYHDMGDFTEPKEDIKRNFSLEEAREFLLKLIPHVKDEDVKYQLLSSWGVVSSIKHADLLADPRLADALEKSLVGEIVWSERLENFLGQGVFPSAEFFDEAFKRLKPEDSDPNANFHISLKDFRDTEVPASVFYFTMLRRLVLLDSRREIYPGFGIGGEEKVTSYLLSDTFMKHAIQYLETKDAFQDYFVEVNSMATRYNAKVEATGDEAKALKRKRLGEVINAAIEYARQKGDEQTVKRLAEREVGGVQFADLITL